MIARPGELDDDPNDRRPVVAFVPFMCPSCGAKKPFTGGVRGRTRFHKCRGCGLLYKSREMSIEEVDAFRGKRTSP